MTIVFDNEPAAIAAGKAWNAKQMPRSFDELRQELQDSCIRAVAILDAMAESNLALQKRCNEFISGGSDEK